MCAGLKNGSQRGLVEMAVTKHLTVLQALLDWQAQSKHLQDICKDRIIRTRKGVRHRNMFVGEEQ